MTTEQAQNLRQQVIDSGGVYIDSTYRNSIILNDFVRIILHEALDTKNIVVLCSKKTKLILMEYFILDGFTYLGMCFEIKVVEFSQYDGIEPFELLVLCDKKPVGYFICREQF